MSVYTQEPDFKSSLLHLGLGEFDRFTDISERQTFLLPIWQINNFIVKFHELKLNISLIKQLALSSISLLGFTFFFVNFYGDSLSDEYSTLSLAGLLRKLTEF